MSWEMKTKHGHNFYDMASLLQKAIRRCDCNLAGYAAYELYGGYYNYVWKRLLVVSAEDCYGIITKEIIALKCADDLVNGTKKGYDRDPLFVAKAIVLLCMARKNRDGCYLACNFMLPERCLEPNEIPHVNLEDCKLPEDGIPDWVYDCHTIKGKMNGKTDLDMTISEQEALKPLQLGLFDEGSWSAAYEDDRKNGRMSDKEWARYQEFAQGKKLVPDVAKPIEESKIEPKKEVSEQKNPSGEKPSFDIF